MARLLPRLETNSRKHILLGGEPVVFHCNHYNYWLQRTVCLTPGLGMEDVIADAAEASAYACLVTGKEELGLEAPIDTLRLGAHVFAQLGFGTFDFSGVSSEGGVARTPTSHYGQLLFAPAGVEKFSQPMTHFDRGFAAAACAAAFGLPLGSFDATTEACLSLGDAEGRIRLSRRGAPRAVPESPGAGKGSFMEPPGPYGDTHVDEAGVLAALAGIDFSGDEEGFIPRFGVALTLNFANFYDRVSYEFLRRSDVVFGQLAAELLVDAGYRCAFNTFGGIMTSAEWDAVVKPMCKTREDWVYGMAAVVNSLGWGTWRIHELTPERLVVRIYDDYESRGFLGAYGVADEGVSYLAQGGVAGIMNLVYVGGIDSRPKLDGNLYARVFESEQSFTAWQTKCLASGDEYSEFVAARRD